MSNNNTTTQEDATILPSASDVHARVDRLEKELPALKEQAERARDAAVAIASDGRLTVADLPHVVVLLEAGGSILAKLSVAVAAAVYIVQHGASLLGG